MLFPNVNCLIFLIKRYQESIQIILHVSYILLFPLLRFPLEPDCNQCVSEFAENEGCDCMQNETCDVTALIPEGCYPCGAEAAEYCASDTGTHSLISSGSILICNLHILSFPKCKDFFFSFSVRNSIGPFHS
jgi:hypothetical protein